MNTHVWLYLGYAAVAGYELYLFLMQRSALEISRESGLDERTGRHMLPLWYASVWPTKIAKWVLLVLIYRAVGWQTALALWVLLFVLSTVLPVPHIHFSPLFRRKVVRDLGGEHAEIMGKLMGALLKAESAGKPDVEWPADKTANNPATATQTGSSHSQARRKPLRDTE